MARYTAPPPASTALHDQAQAAANHARRILDAFHQVEGGALRYDHVTGADAAILGRLAHRLIAGDITRCPHTTGITPLFWVAWAPGRLRCGRCADDANRRIRGTVEDRRCDCCRRIVPRIHPVTIQLPALVLDHPQHPAALPPILARFGLCAGCMDEEGGAA